MEVEYSPPNLGVNNIARTAKKMFYSPDGVARKARKAFVGDKNGIAQLWFVGLPDTISCILNNSVSMEWSRYGGAVAGDWAIFGGGRLNDEFYDGVIALEKDTLTGATAPSLTSARAGLVGASTGNVAYLAAGYISTSRYQTCFSYDKNLTKGAFDLSSNHGFGGGARAGSYALVGGGETRNTLTSTVCTSLVEALNDSAVITTAPNLPAGVSGVAAGQLGDKAVFVGGATGSVNSSTVGTGTVTIYNEDLTQVSFPALNTSRCYCGVAGSDHVLIVAGGGKSAATTYEMYDTDGTKLGSTYSMYYGGWMYGGCVRTETDEYPDGLICIANMSCILEFDGQDGTLVVSKATGLESDASSYHHMAICDFGDEVIIPLLTNGDKVAQFKATNN